jgi:hypothetical protein
MDPKNAPAERPETLTVLDTTAVSGPRRHTIIVDGAEVTHEFQPGKPLAMPYAHAMKFLGIPAFQVADDQGSRVTPPADPKKSETTEGVHLADDEVVARLDELTMEALLLRANMAPGGEKLKKNDGRATVQAFLAGHIKRTKDTARRASARPEDSLGDGSVDGMSAAELDAMLGEEG